MEDASPTCEQCDGPFAGDVSFCVPCWNRLAARMQVAELQNSELQAEIASIKEASIATYNVVTKERDDANRLNGEMLAALIALADRVSVRFGETIKYEPVATGRYLDAAYEVISKAKAIEKRNDEAGAREVFRLTERDTCIPKPTGRALQYCSEYQKTSRDHAPSCTFNG